MIHIYKADYNFLVGIVWREAIQHAQQLGKINQRQYGGCPGRDCTSVTYLEELKRDISIMTRTAYSNFDNDAASCYDQIHMSVASISRRKYQVHKNSVCTRSDPGRSGIETETIIKNIKHLIPTL